MKYILLWLSLFFVTSQVRAFKITGKIAGLHEGEWVYLYTNPEGVVKHKWSAALLVDSAQVQTGHFTFQVTDSDWGQMWVLRTRKNGIQYFFNKNENLSFEGMLSTPAGVSLTGKGGRDNILMRDIFDLLEKENMNPIEKRNAIEWLKRHGEEDIASFATAYFYLEKEKLDFKDVEEIMPYFSVVQQSNPYYKYLLAFQTEYSKIQPGQKFQAYDFLTPVKKHPVLLYTCLDEVYKTWYLSEVKKMIKWMEKNPDLKLLLITPDSFRPDFKALMNEQVKWVSKSSLEDIQPVRLNAFRRLGCVLLDSNNSILSLSSEIKVLQDQLDHRFDAKEGYVIHGYVSGLNEGVAELVTTLKEGEPAYAIVDTAIIEDGYFQFRGKVDTPKYYNIGIRNTNFPVGFYLENSSIDVNIRIVRGVSMQDGVERTIKGLEGMVYGSRSDQERVAFTRINDPELISEWIASHPKSKPTLAHLTSRLIEQFGPDQVERWLGMMDPQMAVYPQYQQALQQIAKHRQLAVGNLAPEFVLMDPEEHPVALKDYHGKYVLIDFWASWCGPCRAEIPNLKKIWEHYHPLGLEILSISIDRQKTAWLKALKVEKMPWKQGIVGNSKVDELYNVQGVPHILLVGPDGKIAGINLRGEPLMERLETIYGGED